MGWPQGRPVLPTPYAPGIARAASGSSAALHAATTPGSARASSSASLVIRACASALRTTPRWSMPSRVRSSTYRPAPVSSRRSSFLGGEAPIMAKRVYMVGLDLVRRDVETPRLRWRLTAASVPANLAGALVAFSYFHFISSQALPEALSRISIAFFVVGLSLLAVIGTAWASRWTRPLRQIPEGPGTAGWLEARRPAVLLPYMLALVTGRRSTAAGL